MGKCPIQRMNQIKNNQRCQKESEAIHIPDYSGSQSAIPSILSQNLPLKYTVQKLSLQRVILIWGAFYGALWSLAPGVLSEMLSLSRPGESATVVFIGIITGVLVSAALAPVLRRAKRWHAAVLGVLSVPLGSSLFGFHLSWCHWGVMKLTGIHYRFVMEIVEPPGHVFGPLQVARDYALYSTLSPFGLLSIPLAILTTLHLRSRILQTNPSITP